MGLLIDVYCISLDVRKPRTPNPLEWNFNITEVFGSNGSVGDGHFICYSLKSITLDFFNGTFKFGDFKNVRYFRKSSISKSGGFLKPLYYCTCTVLKKFQTPLEKFFQIPFSPENLHLPENPVTPELINQPFIIYPAKSTGYWRNRRTKFIFSDFRAAGKVIRKIGIDDNIVIWVSKIWKP